MSTLQQGDTIGAAFPYRIERPIDIVKGNMSEVYLARVDRPLARGHYPEFVVLKVARTQGENGEFNADGLINEVEHIRSLTHPGIVHIYPIQQAGLRSLPFRARSGLPGEPWFSVLEHLQGKTLTGYLEAAPNGLPLEQALFIVRSLAGALDYLHRCNVVHMDIKPENILFRYPLLPGNRIEPVLIDFGVACEAGQPDKGGTPRYRAPERILVSNAQAHPSMDIYALGVVLYKMLTGKWPFSSNNRGAITDEILKGEITAPSAYYEPADGRPGVREHLDGIVRNMMHRDWHARYTAADLAEALEIATLRLDSWPVLHMTVPEAAPPPPPKPGVQEQDDIPLTNGEDARGFRRALLSVAAITLFILLGMGAFTWYRFVGGLGATGEMPVTPTVSPTSDPTATPFVTPKPTGGIEPAPVTTATLLPLPTATDTPASTSTATAAVQTPAPTPTNTPLPTSTTVPPTASPPAPVVVAEAPGPPRGVPRIELVEPDDGARVSDFANYCWNSSRPLAAGETYEVFIWQAAHDWDKERLGIPLASVNDSSTSNVCVRLNLKAMIAGGQIPREHRDPTNPNSIATFVLGEPLFWGVSFYNKAGDESWLQQGRIVIPE
jgi:serine/threonine protein kinase